MLQAKSSSLEREPEKKVLPVVPTIAEKHLRFLIEPHAMNDVEAEWRAIEAEETRSFQPTGSDYDEGWMHVFADNSMLNGDTGEVYSSKSDAEAHGVTEDPDVYQEFQARQAKEPKLRLTGKNLALAKNEFLERLSSHPMMTRQFTYTHSFRGHRKLSQQQILTVLKSLKAEGKVESKLDGVGCFNGYMWTRAVGT